MRTRHVKTTRTPIILGAIVVALLCDAAPLWAQAPRPVGDSVATTRQEGKPWNRGTTLEVREAAEKLFMEGNRLFRIPLFAQAAAQYSAALRTWKHPAIHFNLALAQLNLSKDIEARENLEHALRYGADPLGASQFQEGQKQLHELERQLGRIKVTCPTPGAVVTLDGMTLFTGPGSYQGWTQAKTHELTARGTEYLSESRQVAIAPGQLEQIELKLVTLEEAADANRRWATWKPWTVVAIGGAIAAGGGVFQILSSRNVDLYEQEFLRLGCANTTDQAPLCQGGQLPPELGERLARAERQKTIAVGSYIAGGSVLAAGVVLLLLNRPRLAEQRSPSSLSRRVAVMPALAPDMFGITVSVGP